MYWHIIYIGTHRIQRTARKGFSNSFRPDCNRETSFRWKIISDRSINSILVVVGGKVYGHCDLYCECLACVGEEGRNLSCWWICATLFSGCQLHTHTRNQKADNDFIAVSTKIYYYYDYLQSSFWGLCCAASCQDQKKGLPSRCGPCNVYTRWPAEWRRQ